MSTSGTFGAVLSAFASGRLFGATHGSGRPSVLALHGWGRTCADFDAVLQDLDAVALDLPGFGSTPAPPEAWGAAQYAEAVAAVLDEMATPIVVVGHSFGGRVAVHLAAAEPERVAALVLTGVPLMKVPGGSAKRRRPPLQYRMARALNRRGILPDDRMEALRRRHGSADYRTATGVMRDVLVRAVNERYEEQLDAITCPVEMVWGEDDAEVRLAVAEAAATRLSGPVNLTVVAGAGHCTPRTAPGELRAAIARGLALRT
ncbi:MAG TPA: alpha/beta hydrolase [Acidimicrobiales bacterium]|nr:alpha/beta hydrolase [Acidimicrobiales bacterium]